MIWALPLVSHCVVVGDVLTHRGKAFAGEADSNTPMLIARIDTTSRGNFVAMTCSDRRSQVYSHWDQMRMAVATGGSTQPALRHWRSRGRIPADCAWSRAEARTFRMDSRTTERCRCQAERLMEVDTWWSTSRRRGPQAGFPAELSGHGYASQRLRRRRSILRISPPDSLSVATERDSTRVTAPSAAGSVSAASSG